MAKLSLEQCEEIRGLSAGGMRQSALAAVFGVSQPLISKVVAGWSPAPKVERVKPQCSFVDPVDGQCPREARASGLCTKHYQRFKATGMPGMVRTTAKSGPLPKCSVAGCPYYARNYSSPYCERCYRRDYRHGDPLTVLKDHTPAQERWKKQHVVTPGPLATPCWIWTGPVYKKQGHGFIQDGADKRYMAHRFVWEQVVGPIDPGWVCDHHSPHGCKNKLCINPEHLELVPQAINALRGDGETTNATKTHCVNGHEFTEANTYIHPATGWRRCIVCRNACLRKGKYRYAYIYLYRPEHPIADKSGKVLEHRMVLYDAIGPGGPHPCHWGCGRMVDWGGIAGIHVDHLNGDPSDNRRENLVPSCQSCNKSRAKAGNAPDWSPTA